MVSDLVYLACPYSHENAQVRQERFVLANRKSAELMRAGILVFSPISHTHPIAEYGLPLGWDFWERYDRIYLGMSKAMIILTADGWEQSKGVLAEAKIMLGWHRPVFHLWPEESIVGLVERILEVK